MSSVRAAERALRLRAVARQQLREFAGVAASNRRARNSGGFAQCDDGEVALLVDVRDHELESAHAMAAAPRIRRTGLVAGLVARGRAAAKALARRLTVDRRMRPLFVVPADVGVEAGTQRLGVQRNDDLSKMLVLHRADEPLDHGDAPFLSDCAKARADARAAAPATIAVAELRALVADEMARRATGARDRCVENLLGLFRARLLSEDGESDDGARVVVDDDGDPPREWPSLHDRGRNPRRPESAEGGDDGQVDVPHVLRVAREHASPCGCWTALANGSRWRRRRGRPPLEEAREGSRCDPQPCSREHAREARLSHRRERTSQRPDQLLDESREAVDGCVGLHVKAAIVNFLIQKQSPKRMTEASDGSQNCGRDPRL